MIICKSVDMLCDLSSAGYKSWCSMALLAHAYILLIWHQARNEEAMTDEHIF